MIGKILGNRYEILEKIGEGGMAKVYKAKCHLLNRIVAIKILRPEFVADEEFVKRFKRESQAAASLSHPNIVSIYDVGQEGDIYYIVMEYVNGKTLKQLIKDNNGPLSIPKALDIARQVCKALDHAHKNHIVHRDIKPQNILVTDDNIVKVTDFGIARAVNGSTITYNGDVLGTAYYFSPEQAKGGMTDEKTDIYSLGIVMYEMLTGKVPFEGESPISVALKHIQEDIVPPSKLNPKIPPKLDQIILKATQKDINYRYKSASDLLDDIETYISDPDKLVVTSNNDNNRTRVMKADEVHDKLLDGNVAKKNRKSRKALKTIGIVLLVLILMASLSYGTMYFLNTLTKVNEVVVPNITGETLDKATNILENKNLKLSITDSQYSDKPENTILSQNPSAGKTVKTGSTVNVVISKGKQVTIVPNVIGSEYRDAQINIEKSGLKANIIWNFNDKYQKGYVYDQNPRQGVQVENNTVVDIYVSKGIETVQVPNLVNMTLDDATKTLEGLGLKVGTISNQPKDNLPDNTVIDQSIQPNTSIPKGKSIDLVVSKATQQQPTQQQSPQQTSDNTKTKNLRIDLPNKQGQMKVDVYVIQDGNKNLQYSNTHTYQDSPLYVPVSGKGNVIIEVDIDGKVFETMGAKF
ncbi:Stk1 family PASTA domain-containing Ser/Thr kinase [Thermoanaerobacterium sp. RBIITD]|uniref:Stk1 family PASTA domain-containing Ser/Thr kinase n=1 Tax=Thermoanaerobacterium sp. RBIITD TaxID=1550240 RepID=UPI000BB7F4BF|nr:Stk1 family PASTA domain-containing Ser/Thr kinase [Thermoanaerobacterium sp. RBIITD]SNX55591.1 serine/threonine protein kinase [Thermoanaerobacterium sp. RBIITD]